MSPVGGNVIVAAVARAQRWVREKSARGLRHVRVVIRPPTARAVAADVRDGARNSQCAERLRGVGRIAGPGDLFVLFAPNLAEPARKELSGGGPMRSWSFS
jgi:hypothetical protein